MDHTKLKRGCVTQLVGDVSRCIQMYLESRCDISPNMDHGQLLLKIMPLHKSIQILGRVENEKDCVPQMFPKCTSKSKSWKASESKNTPSGRQVIISVYRLSLSCPSGSKATFNRERPRPENREVPTGIAIAKHS